MFNLVKSKNKDCVMNQKVNLDVDLMTAWRRSIHQNPELGFEELATSRLVAEQLGAWGYSVSIGMAETGVVGQLVFGDGSGPKLGLRADMDALPLQEETGLPWASQNDGKMHACGHDGHTAILLGAAKALSESYQSDPNRFNGVLNLIFQPAEEVGGGGGAQRMIAEGLFDQFPCDAIFALHNMPGIPVGKCHFRSGPFMCSSDKVKIVVRGKGGHGGLPHLTIDPIVAASSIVMALQSIVARTIDPLDTVVISVGQLHAGFTYNIIPESVELELSIRALRPDTRLLIEKKLHSLVQHQAEAFGCRADIEYELGYPVLTNHESVTELMTRAARAVFGDDGVDSEAPPLTGSEDFAYMLQQLPGCYVLIGNGDNGHDAGQPIGPCSVHNPHYDFNDENLPLGASLWLNLTQEFFETWSENQTS